MAKRTKYVGGEKLIYLLPLDNSSLKAITKIYRSTANNGHYTCKFINDTDVKVPFKDRIVKAINSGAKLCFIFGEEETKKNGITIKDLISNKQIFSKYHEILEKVSMF